MVESLTNSVLPTQLTSFHPNCLLHIKGKDVGRVVTVVVVEHNKIIENNLVRG